MKDSRDFVELIQEITDKTKTNETFTMATIDPAYSSGRPKVTFDGESSVSVKQYPYLSSYTPVANHRVLLARVKGSYVIIGQVL